MRNNFKTDCLLFTLYKQSIKNHFMKNLFLLFGLISFSQMAFGQDTTYVHFSIDNNRNTLKVLYEESGMVTFQDPNDFYDNNFNFTLGVSRQIFQNTFANINVSTNEAYARVEFVELINGYTPRGRHILHQYSMDLSARQYFLKNDVLFAGVGGGYNICHSSTDLTKNSTFSLDPTTIEGEPYEPQFVANHTYLILEAGAQIHYKSFGFFASGHYKNSTVVRGNIGGVPNFGFTQWGTRIGVSLSF